MFPIGVSVFLTLLAACMWGSWMQVVKLRGDYPVNGLIFWLYLFSFLGISIITFIIAPDTLDAGIVEVTARDLPVVLKIIAGGSLMSLGLLFSLNVMNQAGLLLATTISGAVTNILGIVTTLLIEGFPEDPRKLLVLAAVTLLFVIAGLVCNKASRERDRDMGKQTGEPTISFKVIMMSLMAAILTNGWSIGTSNATAAGFSPVLTCFYMSLGSFLSVLIVSLIIFTRNRQWKQVLCIGRSKYPLLLAFISACCHYGGNLISIYSMPALSATVSFLFGRVSTLITVLWGLFYKEFAGTSIRTKRLLCAGIMLFFVAVGILGYYTYGLNR